MGHVHIGQQELRTDMVSLFQDVEVRFGVLIVHTLCGCLDADLVAGISLLQKKSIGETGHPRDFGVYPLELTEDVVSGGGLWRFCVWFAGLRPASGGNFAD